MSHFFIHRLGILCIYSLGLFVQCCSPAGDCEWSTWTELDGHSIQHRGRDCKNKSEIESRNCNLTNCNTSKGKNTTTIEKPLESSTIERVDGTNHSGGSTYDPKGTTMPATQHHGNLSQNFTHLIDDTVGSTQYNSSKTGTTPINWQSKSDGDKNTSKLERTTVTKDLIFMKISSPKSFQYVRECLISLLGLVLVIAVTALWCERRKRFKCEKERLYIFSLPQNTELTPSGEDDARYNTMTDFTRLFSGSSAERLSSCVYQDITDMVSSEFSSPRSTYQQIP